MDDELQEVRDNFYVGNFQRTMQLCDKASAGSDIAQNECDAIKGRCCLSLEDMASLKVMKESNCPGQRAASYMALASKSKTEQTRVAAKERLLKHAEETQDMNSCMLAASALARDGSFQEAINMTQAHPTLEMQALRVFFYLMCNQVGMAENQLKEADSSDDTAAFRMAQAATHLYAGNSDEAYLTYCDLVTQFPTAEGDESSNGSVLLQTGKGVANMQKKVWEEAVEDLQRANKEAPEDPSILTNLCTCMVHQGKKDEFQAYYAKLEQVAPQNPYVLKTQSIGQVFAGFKASLKA
mmetsp:Transcript_115003/g.199469  ORF Transcript_115003/g.199469 Transcript_115003/m.199469 type:complete len:296 (-) Transcript_115003:137-1024(-)